MISAPNSRLTKALSATTLALVAALLATLLWQAFGQREPSRLEHALLRARSAVETIAG